MTGKRFTITGDRSISDHHKKRLYDLSDFDGMISVTECLNEFADENEQLKKDVEYWKQVASQYSNELNVWEHCKKYKTECKDIHWSSD